MAQGMREPSYSRYLVRWLETKRNETKRNETKRNERMVVDAFKRFEFRGSSHGDVRPSNRRFATASNTRQLVSVEKSETHLAASRSNCLAFVSRKSPSREVGFFRKDPHSH